MATNPKIKKDIQSLNIGSAKVDLYMWDTSLLGGPVYYITPMTENGANIFFNGIEYVQHPVSFTGMDKKSDGTLPRPRMVVANTFLTFVALINAYRDALGTKVTRIRTFQKYIDGHSGADANAQFPADVFFIEQKVRQNKNFIEFELVSPLDTGATVIPKRQVLSYCQHRYRTYLDGGLSYARATCPYTGSGYYNKSGVITTADLDVCGKKLSDCELRYPLNSDQLPFKGYPGVGQIGRAYR